MYVKVYSLLLLHVITTVIIEELLLLLLIAVFFTKKITSRWDWIGKGAFFDEHLCMMCSALAQHDQTNWQQQ